MLVATGNDVRVMSIKLADRLHNMRTLGVMRPEKQARIAKVTRDVLIPLAERLGVQALKTELEDLVFAILHPEEYETTRALIAANAAGSRPARRHRRGRPRGAARGRASPPKSTSGHGTSSPCTALHQARRAARRRLRAAAGPGRRGRRLLRRTGRAAHLLHAGHLGVQGLHRGARSSTCTSRCTPRSPAPTARSPKSSSVRTRCTRSPRRASSPSATRTTPAPEDARADGERADPTRPGWLSRLLDWQQAAPDSDTFWARCARTSPRTARSPSSAPTAARSGCPPARAAWTPPTRSTARTRTPVSGRASTAAWRRSVRCCATATPCSCCSAQDAGVRALAASGWTTPARPAARIAIRPLARRPPRAQAEVRRRRPRPRAAAPTVATVRPRRGERRAWTCEGATVRLAGLLYAGAAGRGDRLRGTRRRGHRAPRGVSGRGAHEGRWGGPRSGCAGPTERPPSAGSPSSPSRSAGRICSPTSPRPSPWRASRSSRRPWSRPTEQRVRHTYTLQLPDSARLPALMRAMREVAGVYDVSRAQHPAAATPADRGRRGSRTSRRQARGSARSGGGRAPSPSAGRALIAVVHAALRPGSARRARSPPPPPPSSPRRCPHRAPLGIGDPLFPHLGNPGYDVASYDIALHLPRRQQQAARRRHQDRRPDDGPPGADQPRLRPRQGPFGRASTATPAEFASTGEDLVVTPATAVARGQPDADHRAAHQRPAPRRHRGRLGAHRRRPRHGQPGRRRPPGLPLQRPPRGQGALHLPRHRAQGPHGRGQRAAGRRGRARARATTWTYRTPAPHGDRAGPGLHRPLRRGAPQGPARPAGTRRGADQGPGTPWSAG